MKNCTPQSSALGRGAHGFKRFRWLFLCATAGVGAIALGVGHWNHIGPWLPFALVLLCPLMHFFHGSRDGHGGSAVAGRLDDSVDARRNH
ncbi:DUF2933 domain-containing protein [Cupriavidus campinensis]|uniref:DUF2933 domain-containing protein n=1 Tax=Cupriavidus campinensis TaxID=151783 RepID=A0AAE9L0L2_9BURK|nr:DUF2933 domain-containing protein [Cupriavidus campinensis]URF03987.1 DUF2933 domain-containing protein [Cupriavidus campinensis]